SSTLTLTKGLRAGSKETQHQTQSARRVPKGHGRTRMRSGTRSSFRNPRRESRRQTGGRAPPPIRSMLRVNRQVNVLESDRVVGLGGCSCPSVRVSPSEPRLFQLGEVRWR